MKEYINKKINRITIKDAYRKNSLDWFVCKCDCGNTFITRAMNVLNGYTKSCGCFRKETSKINAKRIGYLNRKELFCRICGKEHYAKGLCKNCYEKERLSNKNNTNYNYY